MVLLNDIDNGGTKSIFPSLFDSLLHVGDNYQGAHAGFEPVMGVASTALVFNKIRGLSLLPYFSYVVIIGADPCQQGICADQPRSGLGEAPHHYGMMVSSRSFNRQLLKNWMVEIGDLEELHVRCVPERFQEGGQSGNK